MGKFVMIVQSTARDGRGDEYNAWYDGTHIPELLQIPGIVSARRLEATPIMVGGGAPGQPYITLYELECDNPGAVMAEMGKRGADGTMSRSDAVDAENSAIWIYAER